MFEPLPNEHKTAVVMTALSSVARLPRSAPLTIAEPKETFVVDRIARALGVDIKAADLRDGALVPDYAGIRPKLQSRGEEQVTQLLLTQ